MSASIGTARPMAFWKGVACLWGFDLRRQRLVIAIVVGLELVRAVFVEWFLHHASTAFDTPFGGDGGLMEVEFLDGAIQLAVVIGTAIVVLADHPTEDRAFWLTRPVSRWQLAIAKLCLLVALFAGMPALVDAIRLLAYGAPLHAIGATAVQALVVTGGVLVPAWALALIARTLPRFFGLVAGVGVAWVLLLSAFQQYGPWLLAYVPVIAWRGGRSGLALPIPDWTGLAIHGWGVAAALTVAGAALLVVYYGTRRTASTAIAAAVVIVAPGLISTELPLPPASPDLRSAVEHAVALDGGLELPPMPSERASRATLTTLSGWFTRPALPAHVSAEFRLEEGRLTWADQTLTVTGQSYCCDYPAVQNAMIATTGAPPIDIRLNLGVNGTFTARPTAMPTDRWRGVLTLPVADGIRLHGRTVDAALHARVELMVHHLVGELPLHPGASFRGADYLVEIVAIEPRTERALLRIAQFPTLDARRAPRLSLFAGDRTRYVVPARLWWDLEGPYGMFAGSFRHTRTWVNRVALWSLPRTWADKRLYLVESSPTVGVPMTITAHDVPVTAAPLRPETDGGAR